MRTFLLIFCLGLATLLGAQSTQLAQQYFNTGEYEKAAELYEKLASEQQNNSFYFDRYVTCLTKLQRYDEAEKALKKQLKKNEKEVALYVKYGQLLEEKFDEEGAQKQYARAIEELPEDQYRIQQLANAFIRVSKYDQAIKTYEKGTTLLKNPGIFSYNLGDLYRRKNDREGMVSNYLDALEFKPKRMSQIQNVFSRYLDGDGLREAQKQLYARIQEADDKETTLPEMLAWTFIQSKDYKGALRQARALDRRLDENGQRVLRIGKMAANDRDYETAISAFDYVTENKSPSTGIYLDAKREGLITRRRAITDGYDYTEDDLRVLEGYYQEFLDEFGINPASAGIAIQLAELEALYLNDLTKATEILQGVIETNGVTPKVQARAKIALGDYYVMQDEVWESTLLYSQVDKAFKEDLLGHEARFRNARLSYFRGDFEWAQSQFDVLKASTSRLIANDALDLSVFIMDNLGLDTSSLALQTFADAELLIFQNKFDEAFTTLDGLVDAFPGHELGDDVIYTKGTIYEKLRQYDKAIAAYEQVLEDFPESIRLDNSLWRMAGLYEKQLNNPEKAQELYETLFIDYSNSILAVEARKKYRALRGDASR